MNFGYERRDYLSLPDAQKPMISAQQEKRVVDTVYRPLYTPCGLWTPSPSDPEFNPFYGGTQRKQDLVYH